MEKQKDKGLAFISGQQFLINGKVFTKPYEKEESRVSDIDTLKKLEANIEKKIREELSDVIKKINK